jgi:hypothetical protein
MNLALTPRMAGLIADLLSNSSDEWPWFLHPATPAMSEAEEAEIHAVINALHVGSRE